MINENIILRPSNADRWITCPGSALAEYGLPEKPNIYSIKGEALHNSAAHYLTQLKGTGDFDPISNPNIAMYVAYVRDILKNCPNPTLIVEEKLDMSKTIPNVQGRVDAAIFNEEIVNIFDYKSGKGIWVNPEMNYQLLLYATGVIDKYNLHNFKKLNLHIVQPGIGEGTFTWSIDSITYNGLMSFLRTRVQAALMPNATRVPTEKGCKYCKAKTSCPALYNAYNYANSLNNGLKLNLGDRVNLLNNSEVIIKFLEAVKEESLGLLLNGEEIPGYKVGVSRTTRKYLPEAAEKLETALGEKAFKDKSLITITEAKKLLGNGFIDTITYKPEGEPTIEKEENIGKDNDFFLRLLLDGQ